MTIERAREILGDLVANLSNEEMEDIINIGRRFVSVVLDHVELKLKKMD